MPAASSGSVMVRPVTGRAPASAGAVIAAGFVHGHLDVDRMAVAARADAAPQHRRHSGIGRIGGESADEAHSLTVDPVERTSIGSEQRRPIGVRAPGRGLENEACAVGAGDVEIAAKTPRARPVSVSRSGKAAKWGRSSPSWKMRVVSIPPSIRKTAPGSCDRVVAAYRVKSFMVILLGGLDDHVCAPPLPGALEDDLRFCHEGLVCLPSAKKRPVGSRPANAPGVHATRTG